MLVLSGLLLVLLLLKVIGLDHFDTPLVRHLHNGVLAGTTAPESRNFSDELQLAGYRLEAPDQLTLYWQAEHVPTRNYTVEVTLTDLRGVPFRVIQHSHPGLSLTSRWQPGQLVRDEYTLALAAAPRPSVYRVTVAVLYADSGVRLPLLDAPGANITDAAVGVVKVPPPAVAPTGDVLVRFGGAIGLARVQIPTAAQTGTPVSFTLVWQSLAPVNEDYTVFMHLVRADGTLAAAADGPPCAGLYLTSFWSPGDHIVDEHQWLVTVPPGEYQVVGGLYRLDTGERLPVAGKDADSNGQAMLGALRVTP
jgi:hypothetical protein